MQLMGFVEGCLFLSMIGLDGWIGFPIWVGNFGTFSFIIFTRSSIIVLMGFIKKGVACSLWLHTDLALQAGFIIGLSGISYSLVFTKRALFFPLFFAGTFLLSSLGESDWIFCGDSFSHLAQSLYSFGVCLCISFSFL